MRVQTFIDRLGAYPAEALLVCFGAPPAPPAGKALVLTDFGPQDLAKIQAVHPEHMKQGLVFFIDSATYAAHREAVDRFQRHLAWAFCKFVAYPRAPGIPDPCELHGPRPLNLGNEINRYRNMPWLLRAPLVDSLARANIGLPVLLVLPGPSLDRLGPRLAELSRSCLVVCLARTLDFCLKNGVEPDFLLQLDTAWRQPYLLPRVPGLPGCTLVALSLAPVHELAPRCRGVLFMDSFDLEALPNKARLRESWLSSLFPCLGLAEALAAPLVLVAGADLSFSARARYHGQDAAGEEAPPFPAGAPVQVSSGTFSAPDLRGRQVSTELPYFASAYEAGLFARQIQEATGARFCNATGEGLLDPALFPLPDEAALAALPAIDRRAFLETMDRVLADVPDVQLIKLKVKQLQALKTIEENLTLLRALRWRERYDDAEEDPLVRGLAQTCDFLAQTGKMTRTERLDMTIRMVELWRQNLLQARNACLLELERGRKGRVPVLCLEDEDPVEQAVRRYPGLRPEPVRLWADTIPPPGEGYVGYGSFAPWLAEQKVCLVTARAAERWAGLLAALPWDNWLAL